MKVFDPFLKRSHGLNQHAENQPSRRRQSACRILHMVDELRDMGRALGSHQPVFSEMTAQGVDHLRALPNQQIADTEHDRRWAGLLRS
ncbi:hypothetical protein BPNPMPFG_006939 (plasmid) [Mesorhizobium sp. AR07]|uniref:Uncharacterized protein n=1 Tax=Mesorhizobium huakuii TaxID=28104 RepID=A0A7G6T6C0_9HYPH|nr:hypothetical protein HB778_40570 [Mesorhizobium huakuii]UVK49205.1 hypothetical protein BPNPMPFG_006939 [Mesorhizobium sp. AR07]